MEGLFKATRVLVSFTCDNPQDVTKKMLRLQSLNGKNYNIAHILQLEGDKREVWYYADISTDINIDQERLSKGVREKQEESEEWAV